MTDYVAPRARQATYKRKCCKITPLGRSEMLFELPTRCPSCTAAWAIKQIAQGRHAVCKCGWQGLDIEINVSEGRSARPADRGRKWVGAWEGISATEVKEGVK